MNSTSEYHRKEVRKDEMEMGKRLDNAIFITFTGSLVLSVNFILGTQTTNFIFLPVVGFSWAVLTIGLLTHIFAYLKALKYSEWRMKNIDDPDDNNPHKTGMDSLNNFSLFFLSVGIVALAFFAISNLKVIYEEKQTNNVQSKHQNFYLNCGKNIKQKNTSPSARCF